MFKRQRTNLESSSREENNHTQGVLHENMCRFLIKMWTPEDTLGQCVKSAKRKNQQLLTKNSKSGQTVLQKRGRNQDIPRINKSWVSLWPRDVPTVSAQWNPAGRDGRTLDTTSPPRGERSIFVKVNIRAIIKASVIVTMVCNYFFLS